MVLVPKLHVYVAMRIAIPYWQGRIAPVFDVAAHLLLVDVEDKRETHREEKRLVRTELSARVAELLSYGAEVLICGAISAPLQFKIAASGVHVSAFLCGGVDEVLAAYLNGTLGDPSFAMPGCRRWRWRGGQDVLPVGVGMGRRRGRFRQGRRGVQGTLTPESPSATEAGVSFTCPQYGEKVRPRTGPSQVRNRCPKCGAPIASS